MVDAEAREIEVCATSEMHERKAVGRRVAVRYDDDAKRVYVRLRISRGAEDTWEKIKDGTLSGASIGASNVAWRRQRINGADIPYATHYDQPRQPK